MKIAAEFRHRPRADEPIEARHASVMEGLMDINPPWGLRGKQRVPVPPIGEELQVEVDLGPVLAPGLNAKLTYVLRSASYLRDEGQYDDCLFVDFEHGLTDYREFVVTVFPAYVRAFHPYRGAIVQDEDLVLEDWDRVVELRKATGRDVDGRDSVFRIGPVNYFDRELCRRAFDLTPEEIVSMLQGRVESVSILLDGVLIVGTSRLLNRDDLDRLAKTLRDELAVLR